MQHQRSSPSLCTPIRRRHVTEPTQNPWPPAGPCAHPSGIRGERPPSTCPAAIYKVFQGRTWSNMCLRMLYCQVPSWVLGPNEHEPWQMNVAKQKEYWKRVIKQEDLSQPCPRQWFQMKGAKPPVVVGSYLFGPSWIVTRWWVRSWFRSKTPPRHQTL